MFMLLNCLPESRVVPSYHRVSRAEGHVDHARLVEPSVALARDHQPIAVAAPAGVTYVGLIAEHR